MSDEKIRIVRDSGSMFGWFVESREYGQWWSKEWTLTRWGARRVAQRYLSDNQPEIIVKKEKPRK